MSRTHATVLTTLVLVAAPLATAQTWTPPAASADWNTAGNWTPATVPNSATAAVKFTGNGISGISGIGFVNISSSVQAQSLTFTNLGGNYLFDSSANQTLSGVTAITLLSHGASAEFDLASVSAGNLLFPVNSNLTLTNNSDSPQTALSFDTNTVIGTPGTGGVIVTGPGNTQINGSFATGANSVASGLTKLGPGSLTFGGSGANLGGGLTLNGGALVLDYSFNTSSKSALGTFTLDGGVLKFVPNQSTAVTQSAQSGMAVAAGHTDVLASGTGTVTLAASAINRVAGATVDFSPSTGSTTFSITTNTGNTNGLLGSGPAFATVGNGATWATVSGTSPNFTIAGLNTYATNVYLAGGNTDVTTSLPLSGVTTNSLRFNTGNPTLTLSGTSTLQSGGILVTPSAAGGTITGGTLKSNAGVELFAHVYDANGLTINSALISSAGLTKTGPGMLTLGGSNTGLSGPININRGGLTVQTTTDAVNAAGAINFNDDRTGTQLQTFTVSTSGTINPPIRLSAFSFTDFGTYFVGSGNATLAGVISSAPGLTTPIAFQAADKLSGLNLTGANTFTGTVALKNGFLGINADASLGDPANNLNLDTNDGANGGLVFLNGGATVARSILVNSPGRIVCNGTDSNTISGFLSGSGTTINKDGTGTLVLSNTASATTTTVSAGTLSLVGNASLAGNVSVAAGATLSCATTATQFFKIITLNGGTFRVPGGSNMYLFNQLVTNASGGTIDCTGAGACQLGPGSQGVTINGPSTFLSPANTAAITNRFTQDIPIAIAAGVMLTNGLALESTSTGGFRVTGGGTLFQNSDGTNLVNMNAQITVVQSRFRVTDAATVLGGQAVGNLGTATFTLDGGTFDYAGATAATSKPIALTANGGTIQIESTSATLTANGAITGSGPLTKSGPGTLVLASAGNTFVSLTIAAGTVEVASDAVLGQTITVGAAGTLQYTGSPTTSRTFNLNFGTLAAAAGATVTLNGAAVNGGFLAGPGAFGVTGGTALSGVTTAPSVAIAVTGSGSIVNVTNGGALAVAAGLASPTPFTRFTNQGSGAITLGAGSPLSVSDFQTYGTLTINPAAVTEDFSQTTLVTNSGTSPLSFNGGSRTFVGTAATAVFPSNWPDVSLRGTPTFVAGIDINGKNAIVAGGLFVNNGYVEDSTNNFAGTATIVADFGALVKGSGFFQNTVVTQNGGKFQAGNSPGAARFGKFVLGPGGVSSYVFSIDDATGAAGPTPDAAGHVSGWGLVKAINHLTGTETTPGDFTWTATPSDKVTVSLETLLNPTTVGVDVNGMMDHFDPSRPYSWPAVEWTGSYAGPADAATLLASTGFDTRGFTNPITGSFGWSLDASNHTLSLTYTPTAVPEPGTLALAGLAAVGWVSFWRRRWRGNPLPAAQDMCRAKGPGLFQA